MSAGIWVVHCGSFGGLFNQRRRNCQKGTFLHDYSIRKKRIYGRNRIPSDLVSKPNVSINLIFRQYSASSLHAVSADRQILDALIWFHTFSQTSTLPCVNYQPINLDPAGQPSFHTKTD